MRGFGFGFGFGFEDAFTVVVALVVALVVAVALAVALAVTFTVGLGDGFLVAADAAEVVKVKARTKKSESFLSRVPI
ncbi:MAG: hypothetical protein F2522_02795 [Actinobacteria bacterium]|nr:hypothetical protein [Actinomycetota bacterium]